MIVRVGSKNQVKVKAVKVKVTKTVKVVVAKKVTLKRRKTHQKSLTGLRTA